MDTIEAFNCLQSLVSQFGDEVDKEAIDTIRNRVELCTTGNKPSAKCQCGADAVYHYCRICWCMEIDSQKQTDTSHVG